MKGLNDQDVVDLIKAFIDSRRWKAAIRDLSRRRVAVLGREVADRQGADTQMDVRFRRFSRKLLMLFTQGGRVHGQDGRRAVARALAENSFPSASVIWLIHSFSPFFER